MDMFNCDDVATLLTKRKQKFAGSFARPNWQHTVRTASRDIWLAIITITIIFCIVAVVIIYIVLLFGLFSLSLWRNKDVYIY